MIIKKVMAPVRIDFGGGTTDIEPFASKYGGAVLNAAINKYIIGKLVAGSKEVALEYKGDIPTSSGLGTSGAMNLVWLALVSKTKNKKELAEMSYKLEQAIGTVGGRQDQYASAFGGINFMKFEDGDIYFKRLNLKKKTIKELEKKLILIYTGKSHFSTKLNHLIIKNFAKNKKVLMKIRDIAIEMKNALIKSDLEKFSELMNLETEQRKLLHKSIFPREVESFVKKGLRNGAESAKICGAGGGGCVLFFCKDREKFKRKFKNQVIEFKFDFQGLRWL